MNGKNFFSPINNCCYDNILWRENVIRAINQKLMFLMFIDVTDRKSTFWESVIKWNQINPPSYGPVLFWIFFSYSIFIHQGSWNFWASSNEEQSLKVWKKYWKLLVNRGRPNFRWVLSETFLYRDLSVTKKKGTLLETFDKRKLLSQTQTRAEKTATFYQGKWHVCNFPSWVIKCFKRIMACLIKKQELVGYI